MHILHINGYFVHEKTSSTGWPQTGVLQLADLAHQFQDIATYLFQPTTYSSLLYSLPLCYGTFSHIPTIMVYELLSCISS